MLTVQVVLAVVIVILSSLLVAVGIQVFFILRELYTAVKRINSILGDAVLGGGLIQHGGAREFVEALKKLKDFKGKDTHEFEKN